MSSSAVVDPPVVAVDPNQWLTPKEVAPIMRCSVDYIWKLCRDGKLRSKRKGRHRLIKRAWVDEYMEGEA